MNGGQKDENENDDEDDEEEKVDPWSELVIGWCLSCDVLINELIYLLFSLIT